MFYKNLEHYENTLRKIVREKFDGEIDFDSDWGFCFISAMHSSSERGGEDPVGYDFLQYVKNKCEEFDDVVQIVMMAKNECYYIRDLTDEGLLTILSTMRGVLNKCGYTIERRSV